ncbi:MAG: hypothetical protein ACLFWL_14045 [Candidatus Brocadiia bacterium]
MSGLDFSRRLEFRTRHNKEECQETLETTVIKNNYQIKAALSRAHSTASDHALARHDKVRRGRGPPYILQNPQSLPSLLSLPFLTFAQLTLASGMATTP